METLSLIAISLVLVISLMGLRVYRARRAYSPGCLAKDYAHRSEFPYWVDSDCETCEYVPGAVPPSIHDAEYVSRKTNRYVCECCARAGKV